MGLFDICINVVESLLLSFFVFRYHKLSYKKDFIILTVIVFIEEMLGTNIPIFGKLILVIIPITLTIFQYLKFKKLSINYILIGVLAVLIIMLCSMISLFICDFIFRLDGNLYIIYATILSKVLALIGMIYFIKSINIGSVEIPKLWQFNLIILLLIIMTDFEMNEFLQNGDKSLFMYIRVGTTLILMVLLYKFLGQFIEDANKKLEYEMKLQKKEYEKKNADIINKNKEEILTLQHNLKYILMNILLYAKHNDIHAVKEITNRYLGKVVVADHSIATNNYYFDYMFNQISMQFKSNNINFKKNIAISKDSKVNLEENTNKIIDIVNKFFDLSIKNNVAYIEIEITEDTEWCLLRLIIPFNEIDELKDYITKKFDENIYRIYYDDKYKIIRISTIVEY